MHVVDTSLALPLRLLTSFFAGCCSVRAHVVRPSSHSDLRYFHFQRHELEEAPTGSLALLLIVALGLPLAVFVPSLH